MSPVQSAAAAPADSIKPVIDDASDRRHNELRMSGALQFISIGTAMKRLVLCCALLLTSKSFGQESKPLVRTTISPVRVVHREDGVFFIDFGRDAFAQLKLQLDLSPDQKIAVRLGEKLSGPEHLDAKPGGSIRFLQTVISDGLARLPKADGRRMPAEVGPVMPFRYVELKGLSDRTSTDQLAKAVTQVAVNYPFDDSASAFSCSNEKLNAVWNLCKYSIKATSYAGIFVDGDRERKPYEADAYINGLGWYCCSGDFTLPLLTDEYLIDHPTWPTEWIMFSVLCAWNDYIYTGNLDALREQYPDLKAKSLRALEREDGLISIGNLRPQVSQSLHLGNTQMKDIVDWPAGERDDYDMKPVNSVVNAFHCRALELLSKMAVALGNKAEAADFQVAADRSRASFNQVFFNSASGLYVDGEGSAHSSEHANMFPLAFGLVSIERRAKIVEFLKHRGMACSVYGAQFLMDSLFDNGAGNDAIALMLAPGDRSWEHMVDDTGTTITLEAWDQKFKPNQDWNHAWGAAPANLIPRKVLGIEPVEPMFSKVLIWPRCAGRSSTITWARGKVPTPKGPISVGWEVSVKAIQVKVELPAGTTGRMCLPQDWGKRVTVDAKVIESDSRNGVIEFEVGSGTHLITAGQ
jgi:alpha-L-rhamnosidase